MAVFRDRTDGGRALANALLRHPIVKRADGGLVVLALPRGGVPVAAPVAEQLGAPLDVFLVRKLGVPGREELAMGAIASGEVQVLNESLIARLGIPEAAVEAAVERELHELERREHAYRGERPPLDLLGRTVILIDDGLATGSTMRAAIVGLRTLEPARIIVAVPVAAPEACAELRDEVDEILCLATPTPFRGVGLWYEDFHPTDDAEVRALLTAAARRSSRHPQAEARR